MMSLALNNWAQIVGAEVCYGVGQYHMTLRNYFISDWWQSDDKALHCQGAQSSNSSFSMPASKVQPVPAG